MEGLDRTERDIVNFVFSDPLEDPTPISLPLQFEDVQTYSDMFRPHVFAEIRADATEGLKSTDFEIIKPTGCNQNSFKLSSKERGYHLTLVRIKRTNETCMLIRKKNRYVALKAGNAVVPLYASDRLQVLTSLSEYAKLLGALDGFQAGLLFVETLLGKQALLAPSASGWERLSEEYKMMEQQAKAVAKYLNTDTGVHLLKGPPGTGKSHTIVTLVQELLRSESACPPKRKIVITCPNNAGLRGIADKLYDAGCKFSIFASKDKEEYKTIHDRICEEPKKLKRVVLSTMSRCSLLQKALRGVELIIDEAALASEPLSLLPFLLNPVRCLMVGDTHQLQPLVKSPKAADLHYNRSMMERLEHLYRATHNSEVPTLNVCFRFPEEIGDFCNQKIYSGKLSFRRDTGNILDCEGLPLEQFAWVMHDGHADENHVNYTEIGVVLTLLQLLQSRPGINLASDVVVLACYKAHKVALEKKLKEKHLDVPVYTVDSFQGNERKIVLLSLSRTKGKGFMQDYHRLNVALTRAQQCLLVVGNIAAVEEVYTQAKLLRKLTTYMRACMRVRSLQECLVLPAVQTLLSEVDETRLRNHFDIIQMSYDATLKVKRMEADHMSSTVNADLVRKALGLSTDAAYSSALLRYIARKYEEITEVPGRPVFAALRAFHLASDKSEYPLLQARFEEIAAFALHDSDRLLASAAAIWIRFRLDGSTDDINAAYAELDSLNGAHKRRTKYLCQWGIVLMKAKRWAEAEAVLRRVASIDDAAVDALSFDDVYNGRCLLAEVLHNGAETLTKRKKREVEFWLDRAADLSTRYSMQRSWAYEMLAGLCMDSEQYSEALRWAKQALYRHPGNVHAFRCLRDARSAGVTTRRGRRWRRACGCVGQTVCAHPQGSSGRSGAFLGSWWWWHTWTDRRAGQCCFRPPQRIADAL